LYPIFCVVCSSITLLHKLTGLSNASNRPFSDFSGVRDEVGCSFFACGSRESEYRTVIYNNNAPILRCHLWKTNINCPEAENWICDTNAKSWNKFGLSQFCIIISSEFNKVPVDTPAPFLGWWVHMYNSSALISMRFLLAVSTSKFLSYTSSPKAWKNMTRWCLTVLLELGVCQYISFGFRYRIPRVLLIL